MWHHPRVIEQGSPVGVNVGVGSRTQHLHVEQIRFVGVDGDVEWNGAGLVGVVLRRRTEEVSAFVATHSKAVGLATGRVSKVDVPVEVTADDTRAVGHFFPLNGDVAVGGVDVLQFQNEEVCTRVGGLAEVFKSDFTDEVDVLSRFCVGQRLWCTDAVLEFKRGDASIVLHGVSDRWVQQHGIGQAVNAACGGQTCVHTDCFCIVPCWVDSEMPSDFLAVGHVGYRGRGFELDVIVLIAGLREGHEIAP